MVSEESVENQDVAVEVSDQASVFETGAASCAPKSAPAKRGRPKGSVNKTNKVAKEAITEAAPHNFLIRVMDGRKFMRAAEEGSKRRTECYPTLSESTAAAETLLRKIAPDMRATEVSGPDGGAIETKVEGGLHPMLELYHRSKFVAAYGAAFGAEPDAPQPMPVIEDHPVSVPAVAEEPIDPTRLAENQRADNAALPLDTGRPPVITRRR